MNNNGDVDLDLMFFNVVKFDCAHMNYTEGQSHRVKVNVFSPRSWTVRARK